MTTRGEVEKVIDESTPADGLIVVGAERLLATRDRLEGGGCQVVYMPSEVSPAASLPEPADPRGKLHDDCSTALRVGNE